MTRTLHPTEQQEQIAVMQWSRLAVGQHPELALLHHVPNGGSRHVAEAARLKAAGVKAGCPDLYLDVARGGYHGLRIELKAQGGRISPLQDWWIERLREEGYMAMVCWGADEAIATIESYLRLPCQTNR